MEAKVQLSKFAIILTSVINIVLIVCCVSKFNETPGFWIVLSILILLLLFGLLYGPTKIIVNQEYIIVRSVLRKQKILVRNIESVKLFQPTMGAIRICASRGYFGYWGIFREGDIGRYVAFFGKASDCFLIRMKNGDKYVLGCQNPEEMVKYIRQLIHYEP